MEDMDYAAPGRGASSLVVVGTPIEIPEVHDEDSRRDIKKHVRLDQQVATDEQGRRRFHGAFQGGFSAGYFNTVGSKEGWAPSTFVSSRDSRAKHEQRPEDFMDEEDMGEHGIAPQTLAAKSDFASEDGIKAPSRAPGSGLLAGVRLDNLVLPSRETVGDRLMKQMGWRPGQGVGPRLSAREKAMKTGDEGDLADDPFAAGKTFAPEDASVAEFKPKDNVFGLGYVPLSRDDHLTGRKRKGMQGFGVGALEADDEDIYEQDNMDDYDRATGGPDPKPRHIFRKPQSRASSSSAGAPKAITAGARLPGALFGQEESPIPGFVPASIGTIQPTKLPEAPQPPPNFNPFHRFTKPGPAFTRHRTAGAPGQDLTAEDRAVMLGEKPVPNFIPQQQAAPLPPPPAPPPSTLARPSITSKEATAPGVFQPFQNDPEKEGRYLAYLDGKPVRLPSQSQVDFEREIAEFQAAARLYRPMAATMAARFAPAKDSHAPPGAGGAERSVREVGDAIAAEVEQDFETQRKAAVASKMFGRLTRETEEWHPDRLLCKRFHIPDPYPKSAIVGVMAGTKLGGIQSRFELRSATGEKMALDAASAKIARAIEATTMTRQELAEQKQLKPKQLPQEIAPTMAQVLEEEQLPPRPAMDIFKAIFSGSSSSEDEDEAGEGAGAAVEPPAKTETRAAEPPRARSRPSRWESSSSSSIHNSASAPEAPSIQAAAAASTPTPMVTATEGVDALKHNIPAPTPSATSTASAAPTSAPKLQLMVDHEATLRQRALASKQQAEEARQKAAAAKRQAETARRKVETANRLSFVGGGAQDEDEDEWLAVEAPASFSTAAGGADHKKKKKKEKKKHKKHKKKHSKADGSSGDDEDEDDDDKESLLDDMALLAKVEMRKLAAPGEVAKVATSLSRRIPQSLDGPINVMNPLSDARAQHGDRSRSHPRDARPRDERPRDERRERDRPEPRPEQRSRARSPPREDRGPPRGRHRNRPTAADFM